MYAVLIQFNQVLFCFKDLSPELISSNEETIRYTEKSDIFSFAITCWEIITQQKAFSNFEKVDIPIQISSGFRPLINEDANPIHSEMIRKCWSDDPFQRFSILESFILHFPRPTIQEISSYSSVVVNEMSTAITSDGFASIASFSQEMTTKHENPLHELQKRNQKISKLTPSKGKIILAPLQGKGKETNCEPIKQSNSGFEQHNDSIPIPSNKME